VGHTGTLYSYERGDGDNQIYEFAAAYAIRDRRGGRVRSEHGGRIHDSLRLARRNTPLV
jgi:hypothetical protein